MLKQKSSKCVSVIFRYFECYIIFSELIHRIDTLCNEIENIPIEELEGEKSEVSDRNVKDDSKTPIDQNDDKTFVTVNELDTLSDQEPHKTRAARIAYETLLTTYQKFFTENEDLRIKNKSLKIECEKHRKLYEKRLLENIKLRQRNRALLNENQKLRNRLKKFEESPKMEFEITDVVECCVDEEIDQQPEERKIITEV